MLFVSPCIELHFYRITFPWENHTRYRIQRDPRIQAYLEKINLKKITYILSLTVYTFSQKSIGKC